jgi:hypothetical protein
MNTINGGMEMPSFSRFHFQAPASTNTILTGMAMSESGSTVGGINLTNNLLNLKSVINYAEITSKANSTSGTGMNTITGMGTNLISTGDAASSAQSLVTNVNVTGFGLN